MAKKTKAPPKSKVDPGLKALLEREPGLKTTLEQIDKTFGEGAIMPLGGPISFRSTEFPPAV